MNYHSLRVLVAVVFVSAPIVAIGCGGEVDDGSATGPVTIEDLCDQMAAIACDRPDRCCDQAGHDYDVAACKRGETAECKTAVAKLTAAGATYDASAASRCLDALRAASTGCGRNEPEGDAVEAACGGVFVGKTALGDKCSEDVACAPVAGRQVDCASAGEERRCTLRSRVGEACGNTSSGVVECERGLACKTEGGAGVCVERAQKGESCEGVSCAGGLACDFDSRTCVEPPAIGGACTITCATGAYCSSGTCVSQKALGESCGSSTECATRICSGGKCVDNAYADGASCKPLSSDSDSDSAASSGAGAPAPSP